MISAVVVISITAMGLLLLTLPPPSNSIESLFGEGEVWEVSDSLGIALLFDRSFHQEAVQIAGTTIDMSRVPEHVIRYLLENPYAMENLFSAVLYDIVNHIGPGTADSLFPSLVTPGVNLDTSRGGLELSAYGISYPGRTAGLAYGGKVQYGAASSTALASSAQLYAISTLYMVSPIVLDLDGDGVLQASDGRWLPHPDYWSSNINLFDINDDGIKEIMEWVGPADGLLINTVSVSEVSLTGANLFGDSDGWPNGYEKLRTRDLNHDGVLQGSELDNLYVWQDLNQDAITQPSEVSTLAAREITSISLSHDRLRSTMTMNGQSRAVWDWYPNSLVVLRISDVGGVPPPTLNVSPMDALPTEPQRVPFNVSHSELVAMGLEDAQMVCVTDGGSVVFIRRVDNATLHQLGYHREVIVLNSDSLIHNQPRRYPIPVSDIVNILMVPSLDGVIIIGDYGSKILELSLATGSIKTLYANSPGKAGFRAGAQGSVSQGHLYLWGAFYSAEGDLLNEGLVDIPLTGGSMVPMVTRNRIETATGLSAVLGSIIAPDSCFLVGKSGLVSVMSVIGDDVIQIDSGTEFHGIWGAHGRVLYILEREDTEFPQVLLHDTRTNVTRCIASGAYSFPVLSEDGSAVVIAQYNYGRRTMSYYLAVEDDGFTVRELLRDIPIGPIRLSPSGSFYAYLSVNGLIVGSVGIAVSN